MPTPNVFNTHFDYDAADPEGYGAGQSNVGRLAGGKDNAVKANELPPGRAYARTTYEYEEECLLVRDGGVTLRQPAGERRRQRGDLVWFPPGPDGAHKVTNPGDQPARTLMRSTAREPSVAVYPDSDKVGVWPSNAADKAMLRRVDGQVDYFDGEA